MNLGDRVRDRVTGFTGIALARIDSLYKATQWRVQPESLKPDDSSITGFTWLEEGRLEVLPAGHVSKFTGFKVVNGEAKE
jgi:hypothetical protein